jgi:hypothetical protein
VRDLNEQHILVCVGGGTIEKRYGVFVEVIGTRRCQGRSNGSRRIASSVLTNNLLMSFSSVSVTPASVTSPEDILLPSQLRSHSQRSFHNRHTKLLVNHWLVASFGEHIHQSASLIAVIQRLFWQILRNTPSNN